MIQDIFPHKFNNHFKQATPRDNDFILTFDGNEVYLASDEEVKFITFSQLSTVDKLLTNFIYLFTIDDIQFFLNNSLSEQTLCGLKKLSTQAFRTLSPPWLDFAGITAHHLSVWYSLHKFCGHCGGALKLQLNERSTLCEKCGNIEYPKISPAIIVGVTDGEKLLMSKYVSGVYKNYALIAGFTEIGETLEQTVAREVMEEVGLKIKNIKYFGSQPWAFSCSLLVGYTAELDGDNTITLQADELSEAIWVERNDIPPNKTSLGITQSIISSFRERKF